MSSSGHPLITLGGGFLYVLVGALVLVPMIPNVSLRIGSDKLKKKIDFYEWYWLWIAVLGIVLDTIHRWHLV